MLLLLVAWGIMTAPFHWKLGNLPRDPVPVDAIPDIGENQQIIFTEWAGHSPQDIEDQISYPLTTYLMGIPGVKTVRSTSIFGFSSIYIIFEEEIEFYWSRSRILEKLNALPADLLPEGARPALGPDATALGQVYWYTIEGRDESGKPTGGWDLDEIRSVQDFFVKYGLSAVSGVSEVASIGGFVREYQVDVDPEAMNAYGVSLAQVMVAVKGANQDVGAKTVEINQAEYLIRGLGLIKNIEDLEEAVVKVSENVPVRLKEVARIKLGPANRRGLLDKDGAEVVGGVVVARYGANPMQVIEGVKEKMQEMATGMPVKTLADGRKSQLTIVPFYDRSTLIQETLGTLNEALSLEILIAILVVLVMVLNLRASILIGGLLPLAVLMVFIAMRYFGVDANIVALSGIAIAIGTMVDLGIVLSENIIQHLELKKEETLVEVIYKATVEVASAIIAAVATTIISFIPVFLMEAAEGKLFRPLAFTKTFALLAALLVALLVLPTFAYWLFGWKSSAKSKSYWGIGVATALAITGFWIGKMGWALLGLAWAVIPALPLFFPKIQDSKVGNFVIKQGTLMITVLAVLMLLAQYWEPLGPSSGLVGNFGFVVLICGLILGFFFLLQMRYQQLLHFCLEHKALFLALPITLIFFGGLIWNGSAFMLAPVKWIGQKLNWEVQNTAFWKASDQEFPGIGKEFMPALDEGSFLLMPTSMPHSGLTYNREVLGQLDMQLMTIPEVEMAVGKLGRVNSALDPAPISMFENVINYKPEYAVDGEGKRLRFRTDEEGQFILKNGMRYSNEAAIKNRVEVSDLITDEDGAFYRNWRKEIKSSDDIWQEIARVSKVPGVTSAPKLQPIETRLVMLQTGMRAPMGIKVFGPDLETIEAFGQSLEPILKAVPSVKASAVFADRIVGKPYLVLKPNRKEIARYGLSLQQVQEVIAVAIGGMEMTKTVEGRERYAVRVRYPRELRDQPKSMRNILVTTASGAQIPLGQLVDIDFERGPQAIKSENTFLLGYVLFDKAEGQAEVDVVQDAKGAIETAIASGQIIIPPGVTYQFSGSYENQLRAEQRLSVIMPVVLIIIFLILYFQFKSVGTSLMVFAGIAMAFSGGFIMIWLYGQDWFLNTGGLGLNLRDIFQIHPVNLSVAVWVGFIALFGIATDDGVLIATYLDQQFKKEQLQSVAAIRQATIQAGMRRIKPAVMTSATTIIALLPVLTSTGRGADIMIPMAIPSFGGMLVASITYFIVPVLYCWRAERNFKKQHLSKGGDL
ncbi:cation transporter [Persicobacter diffluens]|uniref:Cation transporter n=2 Tax=Persicobacter diffluens TaxID=981 RepID=A0AAN5AKE3_9BACT|nr:cation transporter [Persicobacter diffluens]